MKLKTNQYLINSQTLIYLFFVFIFNYSICIKNTSANDSYMLDDLEINSLTKSDGNDTSELPANPFEIMDMLRRARSMNDATKPSDAIDDALKSFDMMNNDKKI